MTGEWRTTTIPAAAFGDRIVVEYQATLSAEARATIARSLALALDKPGAPLILDSGARLRYIGSDGRITPSDGEPVTSTLESTSRRWPAELFLFLCGSAFGVSVAAIVGQFT